MARKHDIIKQIDTFIGEKIHSLRLAKGFSRSQLAEKVGVTHQQLQKYEKGINRVCAGRLVLISRALDKNVDYFYLGVENANDTKKILTQHQRMCMEMSRNFMKIPNFATQQAINNLVRSLVTESDTKKENNDLDKEND
jgi:transcriptional regulator with XRE-family HTH domain